jgi:hypothetical protein
MVVTAVLIKELPDHSFLMRLLRIITKQDVVFSPIIFICRLQVNK